MRTRLSTEQRRAQLLAIGAELFARRPYEQVSIEDVAQIAQISSGLIYHYFPNKWAFFEAIAEHEGAKLLQASAPDPALDPVDQVVCGVEVYIDYAARHPDSFRMAQQTAVADNNRHIVHQSRVSAQRERILALLASEIEVNDQIRVAITGWLAFVPAAILEWLDHPDLDRQQVRDVCVRALWAAIDYHPDQ